MDIISGDEIPMYPIGHNHKDLAHQLGDAVGSGLHSGARWLYDHPMTVGATVGAGLVGAAMMPELAAGGAMAEAAGIVEGSLGASEISSALAAIGAGAAAA